MSKRNPDKKIVFTSRVPPSYLHQLKEIALREGTTVSAMVTAAIGERLAHYQNGGFVPIEDACFYIDHADVERLQSVIQAFGKPMALTLVLEIIKAQREANLPKTQE